MSKGMNWTVQQINAVMSGPAWSSTAIFVTWDDWGGFYDHVPPPTLDAFGNGIRVPLLIISPFVTPGTICHDLASFDSLLAFVEHNWNLGSLTQRDANANDLFSCFNSTLAPTKPATTAGPLLLGMVPEPKLTKAQQRAIDHEITRDRVNDPDD
jgi:phospholipase C